MLARAEVLRGEVGDAVAQRRQRGDDHVIELDGGGVARHDCRAEAVDDALDHDIADGNKALLQDARNRYDGKAPQKLPGEHADLSGRLDLAEAQEQKYQRQHAAHALAEEGRPRNACNAHPERGDEENIHRDVRQRGADEEEEGGSGVAQRGENAGCHIVKEHGGQTVDVNVQIELGVCKDLLRRLDQAQQAAAEDYSDDHQKSAGHAACDQRGQHGGFHLTILLRTEELRRQDGRADVAAEGEGNEDQRDLVAVADGGEGVVADEFARDEAVGDVIKLLENDASEQRQAELPQNTAGLAAR